MNQDELWEHAISVLREFVEFLEDNNPCLKIENMLNDYLKKYEKEEEKKMNDIFESVLEDVCSNCEFRRE